MAESYRPYFESDSGKDDDKKEGKKDQRKRATQADLGAQATPERAIDERPQKLGSELLRPLTLELPKQADSPEVKHEDYDTQAEKVVAQPEAAHAGQVVLPEDLQQAYDELLAAGAEDAADDDDEVKKKKKQRIESVAADEVVSSNSEPEVAKTEVDEPTRTEAAFQKITADPELADLAALSLLEAPVPANLEQAHGIPKELHKDQLSSEALSAEDPNQEFTDIVEHSLGGEAPGPVRFHEQEPSEAPLDMDAGSGEPPVPPIAEAGRWGDGDHESWQQPAGGLTNPGVLKEVSAMRSRQELDDLYHTSRENGLASAVGLIGLGLVLEHFAAKRRDKKLKRELNVQNRQLKKTNKALQREERSQHKTHHKLERLHAAHTKTEENVHDMLPTVVHGAEIAAAATAGAVIASAAERSTSHGTTAHETVGKQQRTSQITETQEKVLAERLRESRELGRAIKQNPELKDMAEVHELKRSLEVAHETVTKQEQQITGLQQEVNYEHLQGKISDNRGSSNTGGGGDGGHRLPMLPSPSHQLDSGLEGDYLLEARAQPDKKAGLSANIATPIAVATVLVIVAAIIVMVYVR